MITSILVMIGIIFEILQYSLLVSYKIVLNKQKINIDTHVNRCFMAVFCVFKQKINVS